MADYPNFDLSGRTALVTGAARGLGRAIALALAHAGADVALGLKNASSAADVVREIEGMGRRAVRVAMDVTDLAQINAGVVATLAAFRKIDILVNNVGLGAPNLAENVTEADFDLTIAANLKGTFFASQAVGRHMIERKFGRIVNLSSQAGFAALPGEAVYCMIKAGVSHLTKCLAVEWGKYGITVNAVAPTFIETPGTDKMLSDKVFRADVIERIAGLHRIGEPMDVAGAVVFLCSPAAGMITGDTLMIDGGWTAR